MNRIKRGFGFKPLFTALLLLGLVVNGFGSSLSTMAASSATAPTARIQPLPGSGETPPAKATVDPGLNGKSGSVDIMVELTNAPAVVAQNNAKVNQGITGPSLTQVARNQIAQIQAVQKTVLASLTSGSIGGKPIYEVQKAYNGIALRVDVSRLPQITAIKGVKAIHLLDNFKQENISSVPLIGAPVAWQSAGITGTNIRIGIIDTGIDYVHTDFGGPGTAGAYAAAYSATTVPITYNNQTLFPSSKVVGGYDFAGDAYNADPTSPTYNPTPAPDQNPEDCSTELGGGHGSHVSGTAAGFGVNNDGSTYHGPYTTNIPTSTLKIGPGVAPGAKLYALRVFGCNGSTELVTQAIDWAIDPNNDGDFSDHLDVINMSLGSTFGNADSDSSTTASNNAALAGVIVVAAAGNSDDIYYINGSPATADRAISVAASVDALDAFDAFKVLSPNSIAGFYPLSRAVYGPTLEDDPITGTLAYPASTTYTNTLDPSGNTDQLGCVAFNSADSAALAGKIALIDRGVCSFKTKTINAQNAGAIGVIIATSQARPFDGSGLADDPTITNTITIPTVLTSYDTGTTFKAHIGDPIVIELDGNYPVAYNSYNYGQVDTVASFSSRGPRAGDTTLKPDITAPGLTIVSVNSGTGNGARSLSGTSMATPHITGVMALLRELHPDWSVEQLKALVMNTANQDLYTGPNHTGNRYGPSRIGAGRVVVPQAITDTVIAYDLDTPGVVSVSYGNLDVLNPITLTRIVRVENKGSTAMTYNLSYDNYIQTPGVNYTFPGGSTVNVGANSSTTFQVQLTADPTLLRNYRDPTAPTADTTYGIGTQFLNEKSGMILLTPTITTAVSLRLPVYSSPRVASNMSTAESTLVFTNTNSASQLTLTGQGVNTGSTFPTDTVSLAMPFELAGTNPITTNTSVRDANIQYVGVTTDSPLYGSAAVTSSEIYFGIATYGNWSTPADETTFYIYIDTNLDGIPDFRLSNTRVTDSDSYLTQLADANGNLLPEDLLNALPVTRRFTAIFNNNVMVLPVYAADLGLGTNSRFNYWVQSVSGFYGQVDRVGTFSFDYLHPGIDFTSNHQAVSTYAVPIYNDLPGNTIPAVFNQAAYNTDRSKGVLLFHFFNTTGNRTQVINVSQAFNVCVNAQQDTIVTTTADNETCGSLRHALEVAGNSSGLNNKITFNITDTTPISGSYVITVTSPLPAVRSGVTIDGGSCANGPAVTINGTGVNSAGLLINSGTVYLNNLLVTGFAGPQVKVVPPGHVVAKCLKAVAGGGQ